MFNIGENKQNINKDVWEGCAPKYLPVNKIKIANYQRSTMTGKSKEVIRKIIAEFDPGAFQPLMVNKRADGSYYCYDGGHRLVAVRTKSFKVVPCWVVEGKTEQEEAELFLKLNGNRKSMNSIDMFAAEVYADKKESEEIERIVNECGFTVERGYYPANKINSIDTLKKIYKQIGANGLKRTLFLINKTWSEDKDRTHNKILKGVSDIIKIYGDCLQDFIFIQKMQTYKPLEIIIEGDLKKKTSKTPYAEAIWALYNKRMKTNKLPNRMVSGF
jgi:uncharacterized ParB-like nuclease family protein